MSLPNKLTMIRVFLVPILIVLYYLKNIIGDWTSLILAVIFVVASLTDYFDGHIARKRNIVTSFGKFFDPLADKLLVMSLLVILTSTDMVSLPLYIVIIIIAREFFVSGIRMVCVLEGTVIAASKLGKYKTATTMVAIIILLISEYLEFLYIPGMVFMYVALALTIISGIDYFIKNKGAIVKTI